MMKSILYTFIFMTNKKFELSLKGESPSLPINKQIDKQIDIDIDYLKLCNNHPRDAFILFDEPTHVYTITSDPGQKYTSVTTWNHYHFEAFDADKIITNMMKSRRWPQNKYFGQTPEEIKAGWEVNRDAAAQSGTAMHYMIEMFMNMNPNMNKTTEKKEHTMGELYDAYMESASTIYPSLMHPSQLRNTDNTNNTDTTNNPNQISIGCEWEYFLNFANAESNRDLIPYRTEWTIYDEQLKLSGSIDMVFKDKKGAYHIYDWKRSKEITKSNNWNKFSTNAIIDHIPDTNYWHYCLQLNTYKALLERQYNIKIETLYLVCLHPNNSNGNYQQIKVANLSDEVASLFENRLTALGKG